MSRAIYRKFKALNETAYQKLVESQALVKVSYSHLGKDLWHKFIREFEILCGLLRSFEEFLSPIILASYAINCFYTCLQVIYLLHTL